MEKKAWDAEENSAPVIARIPNFIYGEVLFIDGGYGAV